MKAQNSFCSRQDKAVVGIDASSLRAGGGLTYLFSLLGTEALGESCVSKIVVWAGRKTLDRLPLRSELRLVHQPLLDGPLMSRVLWQWQHLAHLAAKCDALFVPSGTYVGSFRPFIAMSHNLLPFERSERARFGISRTSLRLNLLHKLQTRTFRRADGMIFLTNSARNLIEESTGPLPGRTAVIPHGVDQRFCLSPRPQRSIAEFSISRPFRLLYVSIVTLYKHQWNVVAAVARLRLMGFPLRLDLIGPAYDPALRILHRALREFDPGGEFISYHGPVAHQEIASKYHQADALVFASTCENMPIILLEGMAAGLPIVCGDHPVMREVLQDGGDYCDPESPTAIAGAIERLINDPRRRERLASRAFQLATTYNWHRTAERTFQFITDVANASKKRRFGSAAARPRA